jgi:1-acyl-sn-glycerol-3-phosphate acyltransferase
MLPMAAGRRVSGRDCRFMVTTTEMRGLQGWFLQRLGCFPVDQGRPSMTTLRLAIDLLADGQQVVMFPEGRIHRQDAAIELRPGLGRFRTCDSRWLGLQPGPTTALQSGSALFRSTAQRSSQGRSRGDAAVQQPTRCGDAYG